MKKNLRHLLTAIIVILCGLAGWRLARDLEKTVVKSPPKPQAAAMRPAAPPPRHVRPIHRDEFNDGTTVEMFASSSPDQVILRFPSAESFEDFIFILANSGVELLDQIDRLRAVRLGYDDWADLAGLLYGENIVAYDALPAAPAPAPARASNQQGLVGFGDGLLGWLGITGDNSGWGAGVRVAVLDSGVVPHPALPGLSQSIAITPFPEDLSKTNGHGTAVASLIAGSGPRASGVAPSAEIISIRVGDESGKADSFALAAGIMVAIDSGAQIINISMGTTENNPLIEEAVLYAHERDVLIVAASGNSEQADAAYPAAYPTVVSVGAVDARGEHLDFSNYGSYLSLTAPGYAINAAWPGDRHTKISGTSASAPIVTGAIAAIMSSGSGVTMRASQAAEILMNHANDAGIPGPDSEFGFGIIDMGRVMNRGIRGIVDAAISDQRIVKSSGGGHEIQVTVQNRGTVNLVNTFIDISTPVGSRQFNATTLAPGAIRTFSMPVGLAGQPKNRPLRVTSTLSLGTAGQDATPANNQRSAWVGWN